MVESFCIPVPVVNMYRLAVLRYQPEGQIVLFCILVCVRAFITENQQIPAFGKSIFSYGLDIAVEFDGCQCCIVKRFRSDLLQ